MFFKNTFLKLKRHYCNCRIILRCGKLITENIDGDGCHSNNESCAVMKRNFQKEDLQDFRKETVEKILGIVGEPNAVIAMRKELIKLTHEWVFYSTFFTKDFESRREEIYEGMQKMTQTKEQVLSDKICATITVWNDAQIFILKSIQSKYFEQLKFGDVDWLDAYKNLFQQWQNMLCRGTLARIDGNETDVVDDVMHKYLINSIEDLQKKLVGEVLGLGLM